MMNAETLTAAAFRNSAIMPDRASRQWGLGVNEGLALDLVVAVL